MEQERIEIIYQIIIDGLDITNETLIQYGFTEEDISLLLTKRIIVPYEKDTYRIFVVDKLRQYGVKLLLRQKIKEANICFRKCYELAPNGRNISLQYLLATIKRGDYSKAFEIFANLEKIHPEKNYQSNNLYLYLLSVITKCPEEYAKRTREFEPKDILLPVATCNKAENEIRKAISQSKFTYAYQLINSMISRDREYSVKFELIRVLLIEAIESEKRFKNNLLHLAKTEQYETIFSILNERQQQRHLSKLETYILLITSAIINLINTKEIPVQDITVSYDIYEALIGNNFKLALEINEEFLNYTNESKENNTVHILLLALNNLISQLEANSTIEETTKKSYEESTTIEEQTTSISDKEIRDIEDIAYYISSENISIEYAIRTLGILPEQALLIKLIYARDYYIESNYEQGDKLLQEVEYSLNKTPKVISLLEEIKLNRDNFKYMITSHKKERKKD